MDRWRLPCLDGSGDGLAFLPSQRAVLINHVLFVTTTKDDNMITATMETDSGTKLVSISEGGRGWRGCVSPMDYIRWARRPGKPWRDRKRGNPMTIHLKLYPAPTFLPLYNYTFYVVTFLGESGLGKSTLVNTLFNAPLYPPKEHVNLSSESPKTVGIQVLNTDIEENGVRLKLNVVDTPGFGDFINNEDR